MENQENIEVQPYKEWAKEEVRRRRERAYADPETGSDKFFAEANRMKIMSIEGWENIEQKGVDRYIAIHAEHPYPAAE